MIHMQMFSIIIEKLITTKQEKRAFQLAMHDGVARSSSFQISAFGPENSGKTCLVSTLFNERYAETKATEGADVQICTIYANNWNRCTTQEMADKLQHQFFHSLNASAEEQIRSPCFEASLKKKGFASKFKAAFFKSSTAIISKQQKPPEVKLEVIEQAKAIKISSQDKFTAIVWDYAGQIQYLSTHTVFVRKNNVVFIVFKSSCNLADLIKPRPGDEKFASSSNATHFEVIHYWFQTVTFVCQEPGSDDHKSTFFAYNSSDMY